MASTPYISHAVNGYSRYELPESVAFSASAGILYPVRVDFMNARDVRYVQAGAVIRTNPALVPTFTPFRVSLHRFFCPMQLYHPEMRVNSSKFDFENLSTNVIASGIYSYAQVSPDTAPASEDYLRFSSGRSLMAFLGLHQGRNPNGAANSDTDYPFYAARTASTVPQMGRLFVNCDPILAYYDIIRSYYSFSQIGSLSLAFPVPSLQVNEELRLPSPGVIQSVDEPLEYRAAGGTELVIGKAGQYWRQAICRLDPFDDFFESAFYPKRGEPRGLYYDRTSEICETCWSSMMDTPPYRTEAGIQEIWSKLYVIRSGVTRENRADIPLRYVWSKILPFGVAPSTADRFSRLLPAGDTADVSIANLNTVRALAFASKLQAYRDLLSSGGSRFTDWLLTFFAAKVKHVDRPVLVYSSSFFMNSSPIFSQQGGETLGTYAGVISGENSFGKSSQRYSFDEPGYLIDIFSVRPLYYWSGLQMDYARYDKMDYFNPIFNEVGYEMVPDCAFGGDGLSEISRLKQPCYNEFRASYDRVLGDLSLDPGRSYSTYPILASWVQQRSNVTGTAVSIPDAGHYMEDYLNSIYFVDINQANSVFASTAEDNFFVNIYYRVTSKTLVSKNFATNLATR